MSATKKTKRIMPPDIRAARGGDEPLVCLTAYTAPMAALLDPHCDLLLVGDSLAMVLYGMDSTLPVDLDTMIRHGKAVAGHSQNACVVIDMPFGTYQQSPEQAFQNCARAIAETGASAVKIEGGLVMAETIRFLVARGIPVLAHIGLTPQYYNALGGYKVQGKNETSASEALKDARAVAQADAFAVVLEGVTEPLAREITESVDIPTIGIGASNACDGQILVTEDMLGLTPGPHAKFVKEYADLSGVISGAVKEYAKDVRTRKFPAEEQTYKAR